MRERTAAFPHGGTALTLLSLKGSTKDVDFAFPAEGDFHRFRQALGELGYKTTVDTKATPEEYWVRLENPRLPIDAVDLGWPTWNNWRMSGLVLRGALQIPFGNVLLTLLDKEAIFVLKTYPLRDTDLADLRAILEAASIDQKRAIALFDEQDRAHRNDLYDPQVKHEPLINILQLRVRAAGTCALLGPVYRNRIRAFSDHVAARFSELGLVQTLPNLVSALRERDVFSWDDLGIDFEALRDRLRL